MNDLITAFILWINGEYYAYKNEKLDLLGKISEALDAYKAGSPDVDKLCYKAFREIPLPLHVHFELPEDPSTYRVSSNEIDFLKYMHQSLASELR